MNYLACGKAIHLFMKEFDGFVDPYVVFMIHEAFHTAPPKSHDLI
jgi:hypothetical protein